MKAPRSCCSFIRIFETAALYLMRNFNPKGIVSASPGLRGTSYPGSVPSGQSTLKGLKHRHHPEQILAPTPLGLIRAGTFSQGCSFLATLGFGPESRWDSRPLLRRFGGCGRR